MKQSKPVVLVVEDEPLLRLAAIDMVESAGFEVVEASDAVEARFDSREPARYPDRFYRYRHATRHGRLEACSGDPRSLAADPHHCYLRASCSPDERPSRRQPLFPQTIQGTGRHRGHVEDGCLIGWCPAPELTLAMNLTCARPSVTLVRGCKRSGKISCRTPQTSLNASASFAPRLSRAPRAFFVALSLAAPEGWQGLARTFGGF